MKKEVKLSDLDFSKAANEANKHLKECAYFNCFETTIDVNCVTGEIRVSKDENAGSYICSPTYWWILTRLNHSQKWTKKSILAKISEDIYYRENRF
jgi:hypothetical protein